MVKSRDGRSRKQIWHADWTGRFGRLDKLLPFTHVSIAFAAVDRYDTKVASFSSLKSRTAAQEPQPLALSSPLSARVRVPSPVDPRRESHHLAQARWKLETKSHRATQRRVLQYKRSVTRARCAVLCCAEDSILAAFGRSNGLLLLAAVHCTGISDGNCLSD